MKMTKSTLARIERKRWAVELLGGKCSKCGYSKNLASLDFHHTDPSKKESAIGTMVAYHQWDKVEVELEKCILLCKNCHHETHNERLEFELDDNSVKLKDQELSIRLVEKCEQCGDLSYGHRYCTYVCARMARRKVKRPSKEELEIEIKETSMVQLGKKYGVSDVAVKKWAKNYGIV